MKIWEDLEAALRAEPALMGKNLEAELLKERFEAGMAWPNFEASGAIRGWTMAMETHAPGVVEVCKFWVLKKYREGADKKEVVFSGHPKQTVCQAILVACANTLRAKNLRGIMVTDNPKLAKKACDAGWVIDDSDAHAQAVRWLLTGEDRAVRAGSPGAGGRFVLVFYPD